MSEIAVALVPVGIALLTLVGGVFAYAKQKSADRKSDLIRVQQEHYRGYLFAIQRVLTSCVKTDHSARRLAIDDYRSFEAALYVAAPKDVAERLAPLHSAFVDYTRCIRCIYEPHQAEKFRKTHPPERLQDFEAAFMREYRLVVLRMRRDTLEEVSEIPVEISLASKEIHG